MYGDAWQALAGRQIRCSMLHRDTAVPCPVRCAPYARRWKKTSTACRKEPTGHGRTAPGKRVPTARKLCSAPRPAPSSLQPYA